jgi:CHAT domain-containing protein
LQAGGVAVRTCAGAAAVQDAVRTAARDAVLLHIAGHALYRAEHPEFSALRLHDGWLHARDLAVLPLEGACVVLSACESGPRGSAGGREVLGIVSGLLRAGARTMVSSLWKVDDRETRRFMTRLYQEWRALGHIGPALHAVQRQSSEAGGDLSRWAPFCLIGDPEFAWPRRNDETRNSLRVPAAGPYARSAT